MDKTPVIVAEELHLQHVKEELFKVDKDAFEAAVERDLTIGQAMFHNLEKEGIKMTIRLFFKDRKQADKEIMKATFSFHFIIEHLENFYELNETQNPVFYKGFVITLLSISLSTARGIIYEKCRQHGLPPVIIPVINPKKLLESSHS